MLDATTLQYYYRMLVEEYERKIEELHRAAMVHRAKKRSPGLAATVPVQRTLRPDSHMASSGLSPRSVYH